MHLVQQLFSDHHAWLTGRLQARLGNVADAQDLASETFVRMVGQRDLDAVQEPRAFLTTPGQGVNIAINTWHGVLCPLDRPSSYLVLDRGGDGTNLEEHVYPEPWLVG